MQVAPTAEQITPIQVGSIVPNGSLTTMDGQLTSLHDVINNKPAVLIFYRGSW